MASLTAADAPAMAMAADVDVDMDVDAAVTSNGGPTPVLPRGEDRDEAAGEHAVVAPARRRLDEDDAAPEREEDGYGQNDEDEQLTTPASPGGQGARPPPTSLKRGGSNGIELGSWTDTDLSLSSLGSSGYYGGMMAATTSSSSWHFGGGPHGGLPRIQSSGRGEHGMAVPSPTELRASSSEPFHHLPDEVVVEYLRRKGLTDAAQELLRVLEREQRQRQGDDNPRSRHPHSPGKRNGEKGGSSVSSSVTSATVNTSMTGGGGGSSLRMLSMPSLTGSSLSEVSWPAIPPLASSGHTGSERERGQCQEGDDQSTFHRGPGQEPSNSAVSSRADMVAAGGDIVECLRRSSTREKNGDSDVAEGRIALSMGMNGAGRRRRGGEEEEQQPQYYESVKGCSPEEEVDIVPSSANRSGNVSSLTGGEDQQEELGTDGKTFRRVRQDLKKIDDVPEEEATAGSMVDDCKPIGLLIPVGSDSGFEDSGVTDKGGETFVDPLAMKIRYGQEGEKKKAPYDVSVHYKFSHPPHVKAATHQTPAVAAIEPTEGKEGIESGKNGRKQSLPASDGIEGKDGSSSRGARASGGKEKSHLERLQPSEVLFSDVWEKSPHVHRGNGHGDRDEVPPNFALASVNDGTTTCEGLPDRCELTPPSLERESSAPGAFAVTPGVGTPLQSSEGIRVEDYDVNMLRQQTRTRSSVTSVTLEDLSSYRGVSASSIVPGGGEGVDRSGVLAQSTRHASSSANIENAQESESSDAAMMPTATPLVGEVVMTVEAVQVPEDEELGNKGGDLSVPGTVHRDDKLVLNVAGRPVTRRQARRVCIVFVVALLAVAIIVSAVASRRDEPPPTNGVATHSHIQEVDRPDGDPVERFTALRRTLSEVSSEDDLNLDGTPQHKALAWLSDEYVVFVADRERLIQRYALAVLYYATGGEYGRWKKTFGFLQAGHECDWGAAVACQDGDSNVTKIDLRDNRLNGTLPDEIFHLSRLRDFQLGGNEMVGTIPETIGQLQDAKIIQLGGGDGNAFNGSIPQSLYGLPGLKVLDLSFNQLTGTISSNVSSLSMLQELSLAKNFLSGSFPDALYNLTSLTDLRLDRNTLTGSFAPKLGGLTHLTYLSTFTNQLNGTVPVEVGMLTKMENLQISDMKLNGTIPSILGTLTNLWRLSLSYNHFTGSIPESFSNLQSMQKLYFQTNDLTGSADFLCEALPPLQTFRVDLTEVECDCCHCCE